MAIFRLAFALALALVVPGSRAKTVTGQLQLDGSNEWAYLSKFSYSLGAGNFTLHVDQKADDVSIGTRFHLYLDEDWRQAVEAKTCNDKIAFAKWSSSSLRGMYHPLRHTVSQSIRPHVWYFVIADCDAVSKPSKLNYRLELFNSDGTHFSHEDRAPARVYPILILVFWLILIPLGMLIQGHMQRVGASGLHPALQHLILGLALFIASLIMRAMDYRRFSQDGVGLKTVNVLAEIANWLAQLVVSLELLSIAWAWSVDLIVSPTRKHVASQKMLTRIVAVIALLHIVLILLSRQYDDSHTKYHESETLPALLLVFFRLLLGGVFFLGVSNLHLRECSLLQKTFLTRLAFLGGTYFVSIPVVVTVASTCFAPYLRHQMVALGSLIVQLIALVSLAVLFLTRNEFTEISTLTACTLPTKRL